MVSTSFPSAVVRFGFYQPLPSRNRYFFVVSGNPSSFVFYEAEISDNMWGGTTAARNFFD